MKSQTINQTIWSKVQKEKVGVKYKDKIYDYTNTKYITQRESKYTHARAST